MIDQTNDKIYQLLKAETNEDSLNILIAHIQRIICDEANNEKEKCLILISKIKSNLEERVMTISDLANELPMRPPINGTILNSHK